MSASLIKDSTKLWGKLGNTRKKPVVSPWQTPRPEPILPLVALRDATIYQDHPADVSARPPIFSKLKFALDSSKETQERWAITSDGPSASRTRFLHVLQGKYTCLPPTGRVWPYLSADSFESFKQGNDREPSQAIRYVGFSNQPAGSGTAGTQGAYLGARYESRRENTDWSLLDYLRGTVGLNLSEEEIREATRREDDPAFEQVIRDFKLHDLLSLPVGSLSNGQTRRARIAKSLITKPQLLLLDEPFAGLDPKNSQVLSKLLEELANRHCPRVILALPSAEVPEWITHVVRLEEDGEVKDIGDKMQVYDLHPLRDDFVRELAPPIKSPKIHFRDPERERKLELLEATNNRENRFWDTGLPGGRLHATFPEAKKREIAKLRKPDFCFWDQVDPTIPETSSRDLLVDMQGVKVNYGDKCILGNWTQEDEQGRPQEGLHWQVRQGDRWAIFGPNGSGKTTMISLLTSDHPQAYSLPIKLFGRSRLPSPGQPGISIFDLQARIGHASPEVHTFFPKHLTLRQVLENAWADAFHSKPVLTHEQDRQINTALRWFRKELDPSQAVEPDLVNRYYHRRKDIEVLAGYTARNLGLRPKARFRRLTTGGPQTSAWRVWLEEEAEWADRLKLSDISLSAQKVALFLRAIIKKPDIVVLDEAFSGMDQTIVRKCMLFLAHGDQKWMGNPYRIIPGVMEKRDTIEGIFKETSRFSGLEPRQALICISHRQEEVPFVVDKWLRLPEANEGRPVAFGTIDREKNWWADVWDVTG